MKTNCIKTNVENCGKHSCGWWKQEMEQIVFSFVWNAYFYIVYMGNYLLTKLTYEHAYMYVYVCI